MPDYEWLEWHGLFSATTLANAVGIERTKPVYESAIEPTIKNTLDKFHDGEEWKGNAYYVYIERKN